ncbi:MAG: type II toxin-antitoxin system HicB family antitoxin [Sulfuricellaceae bacterium]
MFCYPATLEKDLKTGAVLVGFPDISFCHSVGEDEDEALLNAVDALITAFESFEARREPIPMPSTTKLGQPVVWLPALVASKALLYNAMLASGKRKADLARALNVSPPLVDRLISMRHKSRIDQIETALAALGKRLAVEVA